MVKGKRVSLKVETIGKLERFAKPFQSIDETISYVCDLARAYREKVQSMQPMKVESETKKAIKPKKPKSQSGKKAKKAIK